LSYFSKIDVEGVKDFNFYVKMFRTKIQVNFVDVDFDYCGRVHPPENGWIKVEFNKKYLDFTTIHHESIHVARYISEYIGIPVNAENDEFLANLSDYVASEIIKKIENFLKNKAKNE
jgi:hypothetical protein